MSIAIKSNAQNFVWNKIYGGSDNDNLNAICNSGSKNYIYTSGNYSNKNYSPNPKIELGNFLLNGKNITSQYLAKLDTSGRVIWAKSIFPFTTSNIGNEIYSDVNDNIYLIGEISADSSRVLPSSPKIINLNYKSNSNSGRTSFIVKLDSSGNFLWQKTFSTGGAVDKLMLERNKVYCLFRNIFKKPFYYGKDTIMDKNIILMEANDSGSILRFSGLLSLKNFNNFNSYTPLIDSNELIVFANIMGDTIYYNNTTIRYPILTNQQVLIVRLRFAISSGNLIESYTLTDKASTCNVSHAIKLGYKRYAIVGAIYDSLCFKSYNKIITQNGSYLSYCAILNNNSIVKIMYPKPSLNGQYFQSQFYNISFNNSFIYLFGSAQSSVMYDGFTTTNIDGNNIFLKVDTLGNVLWVLRAGVDSVSYYNCIGYGFDKSSALYFGNDFIDKITINRSNYYSKDSSVDFLISKIYDFSITRGSVSKGPYCAGDAIKIPFKKDGQFDTSNIFISELSDEEGNFNGAQRELGRIMSNQDSFILGHLPLFDVMSSGKYRIRIISTKPQVQSYYHYDSLRLLIYSKDTANAGKDTTVCFGSQLPIRTSGGSKWRWSPGKLVQDSTKNRTVTLPIQKPVRFRIIISDSSGCGKTDTAYKWILPMQSLKIQNLDTNVCRGHSLLSFKAGGGLPVSYQYQWLNDKKQLLGTSQQLLFNDTMSNDLLLVLSDGCSSNDSLYSNIRRYDSLNIQFSNDTSICSALPLKLVAKANGGNGQAYNYAWRDKIGAIVSTKDTLMLNKRNDSLFNIQVSDGCSDVASKTIKLHLYEPLAFDLPNDTALCYGSIFTIQPQIQSGIKKYLYQFQLNKSLGIDTVFAEQLKRGYDTFTRITVNAKNLCGETVQKAMEVSVLKQLQLSALNDLEICYNKSFHIMVNTVGGLNPQINWLDNSFKSIKIGKTIDSIIYLKSSTKFTFIASDNCSVPNDTNQIQINVLSPLIAAIDTLPLCYGDSVWLHTKVRGGRAVDYKCLWKKDGNIIGSDSNLLFDSNGLLAQLFFEASDGCSEPFIDSLQFKPMVKALVNVNQAVQCLNNNQFIFSNNSVMPDSLGVKIDWRIPNAMHLISKNRQSLAGNFNQPNDYKVLLFIQSNGTCKDSATSSVKVIALPQLNILWNNKAKGFNENNWYFEANANLPIKQYAWNIGNSSPIIGNPIEHDFLEDTGWIKVQLKVTDDNGCMTDSNFRLLLVHHPAIFFPNAISLNGDGINDGFGLDPSQYYLVKQYHLEVYNRWGECVFKTDDVKEKFKEVNGNPQQGVYMFKANVTDVFDLKLEYSGALEILR